MGTRPKFVTREHGCGILTACCADIEAAEFADWLVEQAHGRDDALLLLFHDPDLEAGPLVTQLWERLDVPFQIACSTAGAIGSFGYLDGGAVAFLFPSEAFEADAAVVPDVLAGTLEASATVARALRAQFDEKVRGRSDGKALAFTFLDGLSNAEETIMAAFDTALTGIPVVGGSAGDGLSFGVTMLSLNGQSYDHAAILCLLWSKVPFRIFKSDHYAPTETRLVVTDCDADARLVRELNGAPAASEYANVLGLDPAGLDRFSFAAYPLVVRIGDAHYCRSIRRTEADGLSFFCAIETGVVLTLAEPSDMVAAMQDTLSHVESDLGTIDLVVGFDCVLRRVEAERRQAGHRVAEVFARYNVFGFTTYGEQFRSMHLNQTFTGVAFGQGRMETR